MRIIRFAAFAYLLLLAVTVFNVPFYSAFGDSLQSLDRRPAIIVQFSLLAVGVLLPFHGPHQLRRISVAVLGATVVVRIVSFPNCLQQTELIALWGWIGIGLWYLWSFCDRTEFQGVTIDRFLQWLRTRRVGALVVVVLGGFLTVKWHTDVFEATLFPPDQLLHSKSRRLWASALPFVAFAGGLITSRPRFRALLVVTALCTTVVAALAAYPPRVDFGYYHVVMVMEFAGASVFWKTLYFQLAFLWTILPLWLMLWAIDWIEYLQTGQASIQPANEPRNAATGRDVGEGRNDARNEE